jgi:ATP-dependent helicase HrpA
VDFARHNLPAAREIFIREGLLTGSVSGVKEVEKFNTIRRELLTIEERMRRPGALYDETAAEEFFRKNLPLEVASAKALKDHLKIHRSAMDISRQAITDPEVKFTPADFPGKMEFSKVTFPLHYKFAPGEKYDGVMLCVPEKSLNLLPPHALDYPVPGYYGDFAEVMLRALPKDIRRQLGGIPQCAELFAGELKRNPALLAQSPAENLADFLLDALEIKVNPAAFAEVQLPEYLKMKLAILNDAGRVKEVVYDLPESFRRSSRISADLPGSEHHRQENWQQWDSVIPESVELPPNSGRVFYPALLINEKNNSISKELFLKPAEAQRSHRLALCKIFMEENAQLTRMIRRDIRFSNELKLTLTLDYTKSEFEDSLLRCALINAIDDDLAGVRSQSDFQKISEKLRGNWSNTMDELLEMLEKFTVEISAVRQLARRAKDAGDTIIEHLDLLFAKGFLNRPNIFTDYKRYLRALKLRAQRAADAPGKDLMKLEALEEWIGKVDAARKNYCDLSDSEALTDFWMLLEEARIATFAPEVKSSIKSPLAKLEKAWEDLRL